MASRAQSLTVEFYAFDTAAKAAAFQAEGY